jgi:hypothetical protein
MFLTGSLGRVRRLAFDEIRRRIVADLVMVLVTLAFFGLAFAMVAWFDKI